MSHHARRRGLIAVAGIAIATLALSACAQSQRGEDGGGDGGDDAAVDSTFTFASSSDPAGLDPAFASDGETFRIARQIFEGLVGVEPGTADPAPLLAEEWTQNDEGTSFTFTLKEGVKFHDGTDFNAEAVCANFDRWYNWTGVAATESLSYYYNSLFGSPDSSDNPLYESCSADDELSATVNLTRPWSGFIAALSLPAFSMQSPTALEEFGADEVGGTEDAPVYSEYAEGHPVGTGPFTFDSWSPGDQVVLTANEDYWGEQGQVQEVVFRVIDDPTARRQALESGSIDGYDLVAPADTAALEEKGFTITQRDPFTILYLGFNHATPELQDPLVRQALSYAIDKDALVQQVLPEGTEVATQFIPPVVNGWNDSVTTYEYDPEKAKQLLAEAGHEDLTLTFNYPVNVSRPYMPNPDQIFAALAAQLEEVGITVEPVENEWVDYLDLIQGSENHGIHLLGWTGDYNDTDNFLGVFFGRQSMEWGFDNPELFTALEEARQIPSPEEATATYQEINEMVAEFIPGIPLAHPAPSLAFAPRVTSYPASPVNDEVFNMIELSE
ncbi:ABC transporter substrate-binding protein [Microbacterium paludicola]|uniref:ABC transporter substrate-binding protein n=1 Tax=Microbacterium paludicola TaxID=300019 RepID=A0A4Y9FZ66_9MICO|nr:ABC transporter substrate-binding protein [Microbacterium paludicola]MBF0814998.1 ABC transporter substrate-binding protein [Microbacterium paludicola]TFU34719.1 ABC transporter substrate-binding protein [Microbacterium paludicola]